MYTYIEMIFMSNFFDLILSDDSEYKEFDVEEIINELRIYISSKPSDFGYKLDSILANDSDFKDIFAKRFNDLMKSDLYDFFDNTMFINYKYFSNLNDLEYFQEAYLIFIEKAYNYDKRRFQKDINELVDAPTSIGYQVLNGFLTAIEKSIHFYSNINLCWNRNENLINW